MEVFSRQTDSLMNNPDHEGLQAVTALTPDLAPGETKLPPYLMPEKHFDDRRRILGLTVPTFWIVVVIIVAILAGGIGGGVGGGLAAQKKDNKSTSCPTPSPSPRPTYTPTQTTPTSSSEASSTSSAPSSGYSPEIISRCIDPDTNQTTYASDGDTITSHDSSGTMVMAAFTLHCNTHYPAGAIYGNPDVVDLMALWTPDLQRCADACANYNFGYEVRTGVVTKCITASITNSLVHGNTCILKSGAGPINNTFGTPANGYRIDSVVLISG